MNHLNKILEINFENTIDNTFGEKSRQDRYSDIGGFLREQSLLLDFDKKSIINKKIIEVDLSSHEKETIIQKNYINNNINNINNNNMANPAENSLRLGLKDVELL